MLMHDRAPAGHGTPMTVDGALLAAEAVLREAGYQEKHDTGRADVLCDLADGYLRYAEIQAKRERFHITATLLRKAAHPVESIARAWLSNYARKR